MDYDKASQTTREFFAKVQNKMHYAVHGNTAAERDNMGLTSWANSPDGKILKSDVSIAKNYLTEFELEELGRIVSAYLDLAESRAKRRIPMTMDDWAKRLDIFLKADDREILKDSGRITAQIAKEHAESEYEKFRIIQDRLFENDFDRILRSTDRQVSETFGIDDAELSEKNVSLLSLFKPTNY